MSKGGKRPGAGRPPAADPATKMVQVKMTPRQHAKFLELGGSRWIKRLIDAALGKLATVDKSVGQD